MFKKLLIFFIVSMPRSTTHVGVGRIHEKPVSRGVLVNKKREWENNLLAANQKSRRNSVSRGR